MACIKKLQGSGLINCGEPTNILGRPIGAKLVNASDISSYTASSGSATITRVPGSPAAVPLETVNNSLVVNVALKGGEVYPQTWDVSIEFSFFRGDLDTDTLGAAGALGANGQFVVLVAHEDRKYRAYGLGSALECLSIEGSSNGNGYPRVTLGVEDWQTGTTIYAIAKSLYDSFDSAAPTGGGDASE